MRARRLRHGLAGQAAAHDRAKLLDGRVNDPVADRLAIADPASHAAEQQAAQVLGRVRDRRTGRHRDLTDRCLTALVQSADDVEPGGISQQREPPRNVFKHVVWDNRHR